MILYSITGFSVCKIKLLFLDQCLILLGKGKVLKKSVVVKFEKHSCNKAKKNFLSYNHTPWSSRSNISNPSFESHSQINYMIIIAHMYAFHSDWADHQWFLLWFWIINLKRLRNSILGKGTLFWSQKLD